MKIDSKTVVYSSITKNGLITELYYCSKIKYTLNNLCFKTNNIYLKDDLFQELCLTILEMKDEKFNHIIKGNYAYSWIIRFLNLSLKSNRSPFYWKHKRYYEKHIDQEKFTNILSSNRENIFQADIFDLVPESQNSDSIHILEEKLQPELNSFIDSLHWYDRLIFEYYYKDFDSLAKLSRHTQIPASSLRKTINQVKEQIIQFIDQKQLL